VFRVQGSGFRVRGLGFRVQGLGFRVWGLGFGVWGVTPYTVVITVCFTTFRFTCSERERVLQAALYLPSYPAARERVLQVASYEPS